MHEANIRSIALRDLGLAIAGTRLEPIIVEFQKELAALGIERVRPHFYLSTEWGVPFGTVSIGIPFYLARPDLLALHAERVGHVEGFNRADILRYLRHEMGHVVNYAYRLYEEEAWVEHFGSMTQPYVEEYRPQPFSVRFVQHLPGWYAQKHPDEDWSETFAVWMTPGHRWAEQYADWPIPLAKLQYCDRTMSQLRGRDPLITTIEADDDVANLPYSVDQYYVDLSPTEIAVPAGLDGALRSLFESIECPEDSPAAVPRHPASALMLRVERQIMADVYRWTGHFPEYTRALVEHLARRADELAQVYPEDRELEVALGFTTLITSLAANYVHRGSYLA
ncbi:MAG: hypothetical protein ACYC0X_14700 [Pirellulaceae bacterium]